MMSLIFYAVRYLPQKLGTGEVNGVYPFEVEDNELAVIILFDFGQQLITGAEEKGVAELVYFNLVTVFLQNLHGFLSSHLFRVYKLAGIFSAYYRLVYLLPHEKKAGDYQAYAHGNHQAKHDHGHGNSQDNNHVF